MTKSRVPPHPVEHADFNYNIQGSTGDESVTETFALNLTAIVFQDFGDHDPKATSYGSNGPLDPLQGP